MNIFSLTHPFLDFGESILISISFAIVGLLWRITMKLTSVVTLLHEHERRLNYLEKTHP